MNIDQATLRILLSPGSEESRQRRLAGLARAVRQATGSECPECGATGGLEDNGATGSELVHLCTACDHQWGPGTEV